MSITIHTKPEFSKMDKYNFDQGCWKSDNDFHDFFENHIEWILTDLNFDDINISYGFLRNAVYQISQRKRSQLHSLDHFYPFCRRIAKSIIKKERQRDITMGYGYIISSFHDSCPKNTPDMILMKQEEQQLVLEEVTKLSDENQQILFLRFYEDHTLQQIADLMNMPVSTVHDRLEAIQKELSKSSVLQTLNQCGLIPLLLINVFEFGAAGTPSAGTSSFKGILSLLTNGIKWLLTLIGMIISVMLWITFFMFLGTKGMAEYCRGTGGVKTRSLFIKSFFWGYTLLMFFPIFSYSSGIYIIPWLERTWPNSLNDNYLDEFCTAFYFLMFVGYVFCARVRFHRQLAKGEEKQLSKEETSHCKKTLRFFINAGSLLIGFNIIFFCLYYLFGLYVYPKYSLEFLVQHNTLDSTLPGLILFMGCHIFSWRIFLRLVSDLDQDRAPDFCTKSRRNGIRLLTYSGLIFTIFTPIIGLLFGTKKITPLLFCITFLLTWFLYTIWNKNRLRVFPILIIAVAMFFALRLYINCFGGMGKP